jgi:DNA invertase Pin-like site-specific DNA recombinase
VTAAKTKPVRCAIYTRVSTDHGLEQDFNSLDAQRDAAQAYIRSQAHAEWTLVRSHYDDGGYSGASTDRPALQQLLNDVQARKIDVIVVYKVDRLTRSLADFAKLVELFDAHGVSFVSVTQQFNTTTSMGRLTLNVLLSFAQFEREVTAERIRDKIAASKRKGLWVGGMVPLGYDSRERRITVSEEEAERVRTIFRRYLELGSLHQLMADLRVRGIVTKVRRLSDGRTIGGIPFTRGPLAYLLRNRFYLGEVVYKGEVCPGEQPAIVGRDLFEAVQAKLTEQRTSQSQTRLRSGALLLGRIFDDRGNRMSPSHVGKGGARYRYYVSAALLQGRTEQAGSVGRIPAPKVERVVVEAIRARLDDTTIADRELIRSHLARVEVKADCLSIEMVGSEHGAQHHDLHSDDADGAILSDVQASCDSGTTLSHAKANLFTVPWRKASVKRRREIIMPQAPSSDSRPIRPETRAKLVGSIARGRRWLAEVVAGNTSIDDIAAHEGCSPRHVTMTISLAFLAPDLIKAALDGRLPRGIGVTRLADPPTEWLRQYKMLGLA